MPLVSLPPADEEEAAPVANTALDREALFTAVGLGPILAAKPTLHKYQARRAAKLPDELRRRVLAFVASDAFKPGVDVPDFDYGETLRLVSDRELDAKQAQALKVAISDPDLAMDMGVDVARILAWANPLLPRDTRPAVIGTRQADPDAHTTADFRRVWQVALDPMVVLDDLEDGSLSEDQVGALMVVYPEIYKELRQAVTDQMAVMEARKGAKWEPHPQKAALLSMIMQTATTDPDLAATVQGVYAQEEQAQAAPPRRAARTKGASASDAVTPGQKAAGGVSTA